MTPLRLTGQKFPYRSTDPEKLLEQVNRAYDFLRQHQAESDELRRQVLNAERRLRFWRNLTLGLLTGAWGLLIAVLKAAAPLLVKAYLK